MRNAVILILLVASAFCEAATEVAVNGEVLRGRTVAEYGVSAFLGVPFAAAPVGELRWQAPQDYQAISGTRDATRFAPACMQKQRIVDWYRDLAELFGNSRDIVPDLPISEDCLYLNIWTPERVPEAALPVMVYIHGGSNSSGWSWEPNYRGHALAAAGVVVVSIAYRVGDFGFFAHPQITQGPAVANFGLWDQLAALRWIRDNIGSFGGDPDRVTLFGESAGASDIVSLMFSHLADELFSQSILQSTAGFGLGPTRTLADERQRGAALAEQLGGDRPLSIAQMRALPAALLLELSDKNLRGHYHAPVIDGTLIDTTTATKLASGDYRSRRVIVGTNAEEWYAYIAKDADTSALEARAKRLFASEYQMVLQQVSNEQNIRVQMDRVHTAGKMLCPSQYFAEQFATDSSPAWMYQFSRSREGRAGEEWRAYHGVELPYVFGTHDAWMEVSETDLRVTQTTMSYWLQFARTGNPNGSKTLNWPVFSAPDFAVQNINLPVTTIAAPEPGLCEIYRNQISAQ